ncbi:MAG: hypothetical protein KAI73_05590 [Rhodospirillaceae bacterium]|nr:hypothetical protein [Rhodospirillaceae bacterium]
MSQIDPASDRVWHAKQYPFEIPDHSYQLNADGWQPLADFAIDEMLHPVVASGSNASPARLADKFAGFLDRPIDVTHATLCDFDAVYSAHFAKYGAIPATLMRAAGTVVSVNVAWLDDAQLDRMHATEALGVNYEYQILEEISLMLDDGPTLDRASAYISKRGALNFGGAPVALSAVHALERKWQALSQEQMLDAARLRLAPESALDHFISESLHDDDLRLARTHALAVDAIGF